MGLASGTPSAQGQAMIKHGHCDQAELLGTLGRYLEWLVPGQSRAVVAELVNFLAPLAPTPLEPRFSADCAMPLRRAGKLRADYDLDLFTVGLLLDYLNRIDALEQQLQSLRVSASVPGDP